MKITHVRLIKMSGTLEHQGPFWEERLIRPVDIYPEHRAEGPGWLAQTGAGQYRHTAWNSTRTRWKPKKK